MSDENKKILGINERKKYKQRFLGKASLLVDDMRIKIIRLTKSLETAKKIKNDSKKLEAISLLKNELDEKLELAKLIQNDNMKLKAIDLLEDHLQKVELITTMKKDSNKIELLDIFKKPNRISSLANSLDIFNRITDREGKYRIFKEILEKNGKDEILKRIEEQLKIYEEIKDIKNEDERLDAIDRLDCEYLKSEVIKSIESDDKKIEKLSFIKSDVSKANIIKTIKNDDKKIHEITGINKEKYKVKIIKTIEDDEKKIKMLPFIDDIEHKLEIIEIIKDADKLIEDILLINEDFKSFEIELIELIKNENKKLEIAMKILPYDDLKKFFYRYNNTEMGKNDKFKKSQELLKKFKNVKKTKNDDEKINFIYEIENENLKFEIIDSIADENKKIEEISKLKNNTISKFRKRGKDVEFIKKNIDKFMLMEGQENIQTKKKYIMQMYEKNNEVLQNIDFAILEDKYIKELGIDNINQISCYQDIQKKLLNLNDKELKILSTCINTYSEKKETEEWTPLAQSIFENISEYRKLIEDIEDIEDIQDNDIENLIKVLQDKNIFGIDTLEELKNYDLIRREKCDEWIKSDNIAQKKEAILEKIYGQSLHYSKNILKKFGEDIESIEDGDCKDYILSLKAIEELDNSQILEKIYDECKEVEAISKIEFERKLKIEYAEKFNDGLYKIQEGEKIADGVYEAGTEFKMMITSIGAYVINDIQNYKEDWNRPAIASQHFCTSYIRNDMMGTAPIENICYRI